MKLTGFLKQNVIASAWCLGIMIGIISLNSCKHDNFEEFVGEGICPGKNFAITTPFQVNSNNIDLNFTPLQMTAVFSEPSKWTLTLTGLTSGATRTYSGKSASINQIWYGQPGSMTFFKSEDVKVVLTIPCREEMTVIDTVTISPNNFSSFGYLVSDFDGNGYVANNTTIGYSASGWSSYGDQSLPGGTSTFNSLSITNTPLTPPTGTKYIHANVQPAPTSSWSGGIYATIDLSSLPTSDPDSIYFNAFVYGHPTTMLTVSMAGGGDVFKNTMDLSKFSGWKYVSFKLSDIGVVNPWVINVLEFGFGPPAAGQLNEINVDFALFTVGEPLYQEQ